MSFLLFVLSLIFFFLGIFFIINDSLFLVEWLFLSFNSMNFYMSLVFDWMSLIFMSFVLGISSFVMFYSNEYMYSDLNKNRFFYLLIMFILSMMFLIISPNLVSILIGWDGLGLISYCLIIYYQNYKSYNAGMLTALMNRIGDVALILSISWISSYGSWYYLFYLNKMINVNFICFLIILAAFTKSAQLPFSSWLPAAMAAPTPVSALVHSSTLVTAGVYLLIRFNFLIVNFYFIDFFICLSLLTMIMSSLGANFEFDLSKIIAMSTLSQLGFMMSTLMLGFPTLAFFHLLVHALFSALLFLCSGILIHYMWGNQDIRFMGGLVIQVPITTSCMNVSNLALCGIPFLSGFYSKDLIIEVLMMHSVNFLFMFMFFLSVGLTIMYSFRLSYYLLCGNFNSFSFISIYDCSSGMLFSINFMVLFSILGGSFMSWLIFKSPIIILLPFDLKIVILLFVFFGGWLGYESNFYIEIMKFPLINYFFGSMWFMPMFSTYFLTNNSFLFMLSYFKLVDYGWGEYFGSSGIFNLLFFMTKFNQGFQFNNFKVYMLISIFWLLFVLVYMI
uniref:NADH-ubiquinone oxidoreductase chain 5 n=1 Tax=Mahanarva spectabilis TaxID=1985197 RepID=A0A343YVJ8_9HEMI|nr:NADH dehydrogenase subunit 5 [Mahanarva spectabilis]